MTFQIQNYRGVPIVTRKLFRECPDRRRHGGLVRWHPDAYAPCPSCAKRTDETLSTVYLIGPSAKLQGGR